MFCSARNEWNESRFDLNFSLVFVVGARATVDSPEVPCTLYLMEKVELISESTNQCMKFKLKPTQRIRPFTSSAVDKIHYSPPEDNSTRLVNLILISPPPFLQSNVNQHHHHRASLFKFISVRSKWIFNLFKFAPVFSVCGCCRVVVFPFNFTHLSRVN